MQTCKNNVLYINTCYLVIIMYNYIPMNDSNELMCTIIIHFGKFACTCMYAIANCV